MTHALADSMAKACLFLLVAVAVADDATCAASSPGCPSKVQADANTLLQTGVRIGDELAPGRTDEEEEKNTYTDEAAADKAATAGEKAADEQASRERSEKKALRKSNLQLQKQVDKLLKIAASRTVMGPTKAAADKAATAAETAADEQAAASAHSTRTRGENKTRHFGSLLMMKNATTMLAGIQEMARSAEAPAFDQVKEIKILLESMSAILQSTREAATNATKDARASVQLCNTQWDNHFEAIQADFTRDVKGPGPSSQRSVHKQCRLGEKAKYDFNLTDSDSPCLKLGASLHDIKQDSFALANFLKVLGQRSDLVMTVNNFVQKLTSDAAEMNSLDASCTAQEGELANKKAECNGKQGEFQQGFCDIKTRLEGQSNTLDECYATSVAAYNRHVTNTQTLVVKWNIEEVTVQKIVCFCDVWLADTDTADKDTAGNDRSQVNQTGKFEACNALNESHAEVDYGQVDPKAAVNLSSVSNHPGESGFITEENGYFDDFYLPVVPCTEATTTVPKACDPNKIGASTFNWAASAGWPTVPPGWTAKGFTGGAGLGSQKLCGDGWSAYARGSSQGELEGTLNGNGVATVQYSDCWKQGHTVLYLNGVRKDQTTDKTGEVKTYSFDFTNGDKLLFKDEGDNAVMHIKSITYACATQA